MAGRPTCSHLTCPATPAGQGGVAAAAQTRCSTPCVLYYEPNCMDYKGADCRTEPSSRLLGFTDFYE